MALWELTETGGWGSGRVRDEGGSGPGGCRVGRRADGVQDTCCRVYPLVMVWMRGMEERSIRSDPWVWAGTVGEWTRHVLGRAAGLVGSVVQGLTWEQGGA